MDYATRVLQLPPQLPLCAYRSAAAAAELGAPSRVRRAHRNTAPTSPRFASEERETSQSGARIRAMSQHTLDALMVTLSLLVSLRPSWA